MNISQARLEEMQQNKEALKGKNIDIVSAQLLRTQEHNHQVQSEMVDLRRMLTQANQDIAELRGEVAALKAMGFRGIMGTGSTVHSADD